MRGAWLLVCIVSLTFAGEANAAAPTMSHLFPPGGQRGTKVNVICHGSFRWPLSVDAPGVDVVVAKDSGKLEVTIPKELAADRVWFRFYTEEGATAAIPFLIGGLPELNEIEPNNAVRNAHAVPPSGVIVNGALKDRDVDGFTVYVEAGQTLVAALDANTMLGAPMDAILQIVSPDGIVAAENHDDVDLDPRVAYTATKSGTHVVRLFAFPSTPGQSIAFHGGPNYVYRLTLTTGSFVTHAVPLAVPSKEPGQVDLRGWNLPAGAKSPVLPFGGPRLVGREEFDPVADFRNTHEIRLGYAMLPHAGGGARVRLSPENTVPGIAVGDEKNPQPLTLPAVATGLLKTPRQQDFYKFPLKKGDQLQLTLETRNLYFPLDPRMRLLDPTGALAAEFDDATPAKLSSLAHTAAHDGEYKLIVSDKYHKGGERSYYRLTARVEVAEFELAAAADSLVVAANKPTELAVQIFRRAAPGVATGPITIEVLGLPPGIEVPAVVSEPTGDTAAKVTLKFNSTGTPFNGPIRIVGRATAPVNRERFARTPAQLGNCRETLWLTGVEKQ